MYTRVSIVLLSIFFFTTAIHGGRTPFNKQHDSAQSMDGQNILDLNGTLSRSRRDSTDEQQQFREQMLQVHNKYRPRHCALPLTLDNHISNGAQQYAQHLADTNTFEHSGAKGLGENLYMIRSSHAISSGNAGRDATNAWYNEIHQYDFNQGGFSMKTGHFTQVVWKSSEKLGAGIAFNSGRTKAYVVARYSSPGNYEGQYGDNVFPADCLLVAFLRLLSG